MDIDTQLLARYVRTRDADAFTQLVRRHGNMVFAVARRITLNHHDAEEVTQGCFLELARHAARIHGSLVAWLHTSAANRAIDVQRAAASRRRHEQAVAQPEIQADAGWSEIAPLVDVALAELPEELRIPMILYHFEGRAQADIAVELGINQSTVSRRLETAVAALRTKLEAAGVSAPCAATLPVLLAQHAMVTMPRTLVVGLGKLAVAGVAPSATTTAAAGSSSLAFKGGVGFGIKVAAALMLTAAVSTAGIKLLPRQAPLVAVAAPADSQSPINVADIQSFSCKMSANMSLPGMGDQKLSGDWLVAEPGHIRQVIQMGQMQVITIMDMNAGQMLTLQPKFKMAMMVNITDMSEEMQKQSDLLGQWKSFDAKDFDQIGQKTIGGRAAVGYRKKVRADNEPNQGTFWIDPQTRLPLEADMVSKTALTPQTTMVLSDFKWNVPYDEGTFSLTPPPGYKLTNMSMPGSQPTENDLIEVLRTTAQMNNNTFLDHLDLKNVMQLLGPQLGRGTTSPKSKAKTEKLLAIVRGVMFTNRPDIGSDWHYAGKGVLLNQPATAIMWYKPKSSTSYRVIDADLTIHEMPANQLPPVTSDALNALAKPSILPKVLADMPHSLATAAQAAKRTVWRWIPWAAAVAAFAIAGLMRLRQRRRQPSGVPLRGFQGSRHT